VDEQVLEVVVEEVATAGKRHPRNRVAADVAVELL